MNITLRAMEPEDLELLYQIENDPEVWNVGATNVPYSRWHLRRFIEAATDDIYTDGEVRLIIDTDRGVAGIVDLINFEPRHQRAEIGIIVRNEFRNQGIASEALLKLANHSKRIFHLHQLYAIVSVENHPSVALFEKMGYKKSAHLKDWLYDGQNYQDAEIFQIFL